MIDIQLANDGDIDLTGEGVVTDLVAEHHQRDILKASQGDFREHPDMGINGFSFVNDADPASFLRTVKKQMLRDGMKVNDIRLEGDNLVIDAWYENS